MNKKIACVLILTTLLHTDSSLTSHKGRKIAAHLPAQSLDVQVDRFLGSIKKEIQLLGNKKAGLDFCTFLPQFFGAIEQIKKLLNTLEIIEKLQGDGYGHIHGEWVYAVTLDYSFLENNIVNPSPRINGKFFIINDIEAVGSFFYIEPLIDFNALAGPYLDTHLNALDEQALEVYDHYKSTDNISVKGVIATALHTYLVHRFAYSLIHSPLLALKRNQPSFSSADPVFKTLTEWENQLSAEWKKQSLTDPLSYLLITPAAKQSITQGVKLFKEIAPLIRQYALAYDEIRHAISGMPQAQSLPETLSFPNLAEEALSEHQETPPAALPHPEKAAPKKKKKKKKKAAAQPETKQEVPAASKEALQEPSSSSSSEEEPEQPQPKAKPAPKIPAAKPMPKPTPKGRAPKIQEGWNLVESLPAAHYARRVAFRFHATVELERENEAAYHDTPYSMDPYLIKYGQKTVRMNQTTKTPSDIQYQLNGLIKYPSGKKEQVVFIVTQGADGRIYHRGVSRIKDQKTLAKSTTVPFPSDIQELSDEEQAALPAVEHSDRNVTVLNDPFSAYFKNNASGVEYIIFKK